MKKQWTTLSKAAIWLVATTSAFLFPPPRDLSGPETSTVKFVTFAVAIVVALLTLVFRAYKARKYTRLWATVSICFLIAGSVLYFVYDDTAAQRSVNYDGKRVATGTVYTALAVDYKRTRPALTDTDLVQFSAGQPALVWTAESIRSSARTMALQYSGAVIAFAVSLMSAVQALDCSRRRS